MRTIPSFVFFVTVCCGFFTAPFMAKSAYSQTPFEKDSRVSFSAYIQTGIFYGQAEEIVYQDSQSSDYLSQLLWDLKPLAYAGAGLSFSLNERKDAVGLYTDLSFRVGIPAQTGIMEDRDWKKPSTLTNYSVHYNYITQAFLTDFTLGISLPLKHQNRILAFLNLETALSYRYFDWVARDGYYQYDVTNGWDTSDPITLLSGDVLEYYQQWLTVSPGFAIAVPILSRWLVEVSLNISPGWIWIWDRDNHILTNTKYYDYLTGGSLVDCGLTISYSFNTHLGLESTVSYRYIRNSRGDILESVNDQLSSWSNKQAGAGFHALDAGLIFKVFF
jgi:outer membrane protease